MAPPARRPTLGRFGDVSGGKVVLVEVVVMHAVQRPKQRVGQQVVAKV
jgi:hypothetical protein